jgi:hypothetical protein
MHNTDRKLFKIAQPETFVVDRIAQRIIENKKHFDEIVIRFKEVVNSEEIELLPNGAATERSSAAPLHERTSCGGRAIRKGGRDTSLITSCHSSVAVLTFPRLIRNRKSVVLFLRATAL